MASAELAATYAALILADDGIEITADKITALTNAASVELEPIWASLLAKALEGKNVKELLSNVGAGGAGPAAAAAPGAAAGGAAAADAPKEEEKKEEEKEESDDDMVRSILPSRPRKDFSDMRCVPSRASVSSTKRVQPWSAPYVFVALVFIVSHSNISHAPHCPPYCVVLSMSHLLRMPKT
ncbi:hypothetical protein L226DRAFT_386746 [Lentinus tigrinus ALCF2SS1-7]|uniref:ribosomal P1 domain-containing protein n=1 Tax=Lentinus tigrinus ALCF2SS1-7 TaxID=1328758 RepID=UPI001165F9F1|nr:hypothetical protein L226DRAFT_386746 [Lentinus tigrinus ALCF2SS1-7]